MIGHSITNVWIWPSTIVFCNRQSSRYDYRAFPHSSYSEVEHVQEAVLLDNDHPIPHSICNPRLLHDITARISTYWWRPAKQCNAVFEASDPFGTNDKVKLPFARESSIVPIYTRSSTGGENDQVFRQSTISSAVGGIQQALPRKIFANPFPYDAEWQAREELVTDRHQQQMAVVC